ncbi:MAG TPA: glycosyltransferase family 2 protein [Candidatus Kapabacteria bacterium]|nr:glycosyltransferase family 2 protein [Candidatus Kapabacteria bacterium]
MFVSGFSFIRNAIKFDYPVIESIKSILPICDEFVIAVGNSEDDTKELIKSIDCDKIKIIDTIWDDTLREGGKVLAIETSKAFKAINNRADWAFYIQADEVVHEKYLPLIQKEMAIHLDNKQVDGLLFAYRHFYGSYDYIGESNRWYRNEIRIIRNNSKIYPYRDAQGFRKDENQKLNVKKIDAEIYHYGWVKHPKYQQAKHEEFYKLWHTDEWMNQNIEKRDEFDYSKVDALDLFVGSHPEVMKDRVMNKNWKFDHDLSFKNYRNKEKIQRLIEKITGYRVGEYKNYKII